MSIKFENDKFLNQGKELWQSQSETAIADLGFCGGNDKIKVQINKLYGKKAKIFFSKKSE